MHDSMTVAFELRWPLPQVRPKHGAHEPGISLPFAWTRKHELYWASAVTVWHVEPRGADSGTVCKYEGHWQWHVHHWRLQFHTLQHLRRRLLTRCEWCHGRSKRGDWVNVSMGWGPRKRSPWWRGERGLFHSDCLSIHEAHRACVCGPREGRWAHMGTRPPYGQCFACGGYRAWHAVGDPAADVKLATTTLLQSIPRGQRDPNITRRVSEMWRDYRREASDAGS